MTGFVFKISLVVLLSFVLITRNECQATATIPEDYSNYTRDDESSGDDGDYDEVSGDGNDRPCEGHGLQTTEYNTGTSSRIVGGGVTRIQNWPWQVGLLQSNGNNDIFCGGSLLNQEWALTAAHCISDFVSSRRGSAHGCFEFDSSPRFKVVLGESHLKEVEGNELYRVDGEWGAWGDWTPCSKSCDIGIARRNRYCNNPRPQNNGQPCIGNKEETRRCSERRCPTPSVVTSTPPTSTICGRPKKSRIVGGKVTSNRDWPWQVGLQLLDDDFIFCGGSLIDREWVLTAAHCIYRNNPSRSGCVEPNPGLRVVIGEFDVENIEGHEVYKTISKVCMHPRYDHSIYDYDIALLRFDSPLPGYNETMLPVCLPSANTPFPTGTNCSVTGWGKTSQSGWVSNKLRVAQVPIIDHATCKDEYLARTGDTVTNRMICAGYKAGKIDSCKGDSGGPFVCQDRGRYVLAGATSWGVGCAQAGQPGVYTNIKEFVSWIKNNTVTPFSDP